MRTLKWIAPLLFFAFILTGCTDNSEEEKIAEYEAKITGTWTEGTIKEEKRKENGMSTCTYSISKFEFQASNELYAKICNYAALNCTWSCGASTITIVGLNEYTDNFDLVTVRDDMLVFRATLPISDPNSNYTTRIITITLTK